MSRTAVVTAFVFSMFLSAQDSPSREALLGKWQGQENETSDSWSLASDGGLLQLTRSDRSGVTLKVECKTDGKECQGTDENKKATFSMYFNGRNLVVLETRGSGVIKRRFSVDTTGELLTINVDPVTGPGKQETVHLSRALRAGLAQ